MTTKIQENEQECLLCLKMADLQCSHIVPAFVFRWMKRSSISRTLRSAQAPNRRIQDGPKRPWLCRECESCLSGWETDFANKLFHPILADGRATHRYSSWMALFCASLCWRTLKLARLEVECNFLQADRLSLTDKALHRWREFIFGAADPGKFELHFIPLDGIVSAVGGELHPFINRYLALGVDAEILEDEANVMVYVKLPRIGHPWDGSARISEGVEGHKSSDQRRIHLSKGVPLAEGFLCVPESSSRIPILNE